MIALTRQCKSGELSDCIINTKYVTAAIYVEEMDATAVSIYRQPTIWVLETPDEILEKING